MPRPDYPLAGRYSTDTGWAFSNPTSFEGPLKLLVREQRGSWLRVEVPVRPNGTEGWVAAADVDLSTSTQRVELSVGERMLRVFDSSTLISETPVVVGKDETRTPLGRFFITDRVPQEDPAGFYGPLVLPLSAYSEQLDKFDEGVPVIAIHGTSRPDLLGTAASNGCVRMPNDVITAVGRDPAARHTRRHPRLTSDPASASPMSQADDGSRRRFDLHPNRYWSWISARGRDSTSSGTASTTRRSSG